MAAKYNTVGELAAAYLKGEIPKGYKLTIDSWECYLYVGPDDENVECVFRMGTDDLLRALLGLVGIPHRGA